MRSIPLLAALAIASSPAIALAAPEGAAYDYKTDASIAWEAGFTGSGQTVAVIDAPIDSSHPWLLGHVTAEACFSQPSSPFLYPGCRGDDGAAVPGPRFGPGAAAKPSRGGNLSDGGWIMLGDPHGTGVASLVAGSMTRIDGSLGHRGIAPDAGIVAVNATSVSETPLQLVFDETNLLEALEWVNENRATYDIKAVNLSLGGHYVGPPNTNCDQRSQFEPDTWQPVRVAINQLIANGIPVVAAAGNESGNRLDFPACLSNVISVAALDIDTGAVSSGSNTSSKTTMLAPGENIRVAAHPGTTAVRGGTSYAVPMVSGAIALYRQKYPQATVAQIRKALTTTGTPVRLRGSIWKRSLNVAELLKIQPKEDLGNVDGDCIDIRFEPRANQTKRRGFVKLTCAPSAGSPDSLVVMVAGPNIEAERRYTNVPIAPARFYTDNNVTFGPGAFTPQSGRYRVCYALYASADRGWPAATDCAEFTV